MPPKTLRNCHVLTIDVLQIWPFHPQPTTTPLALTGWQIVDQQLLHGLTRPGQPRGRDESSNTNDLSGSSIWFSMMFQDVPRFSKIFLWFSGIFLWFSRMLLWFSRNQLGEAAPPKVVDIVVARALGLQPWLQRHHRHRIGAVCVTVWFFVAYKILQSGYLT